MTAASEKMAAPATMLSSTTLSAKATAATAARGEVDDEGLLVSLFWDRFQETQWPERPEVGLSLREVSAWLRSKQSSPHGF